MRSGRLVALVTVLLASGALGGQSPAPDRAALEKKLAALEEQITALQREAAQVRRQLAQVPPGKVQVLTPQEAVESYRRNPDQPVTVEFGVEEGTDAVYTGLGPDPRSFLVAVWDHPLAGGGQFRAIITSRAFSALRIPSRERGKPAVQPSPDQAREMVARHIDEHGVRVTGLVRKSRGEAFADDYFIKVDDPSKVMLYISVAPKPVRRR